MKIALVTPYEYPYPGGVTEHVSHLDHCFRGWGHDVKIIAPCSETEERVTDNVIGISGSIISVPFSGSVSRVSFSPRIYRRVKRLLARERFDVVHLHAPLTPTLPLTVLRHSKTVNVGTFHAYREDNPGLKVGRRVLERFMAKLDAKICVSQVSREMMSKYFPGDYTVIPNGIDVERFAGVHVKPIERFDDGRPNVLFVGRLDKRKGFEYLLRAYSRVLVTVPDARLIVVGAYDDEDKAPFLRYARSHHLNSVKFVGRVSSADLPRYYRICDVFCAPSTGYESFGIVLLEAMAAGKPIVATNIAGYRSVLEESREGLLVEPEDELALAEAIVTLLQDAALRQEMGARGQDKARRYDWSIVAGQVLDLYRQVVHRKKGVG